MKYLKTLGGKFPFNIVRIGKEPSKIKYYRTLVVKNVSGDIDEARLLEWADVSVCITMNMIGRDAFLMDDVEMLDGPKVKLGK